MRSVYIRLSEVVLGAIENVCTIRYKQAEAYSAVI